MQDFPAADNISVGTGSIASSAPDPTEDILRLYKNHTADNDRPMYRKDILYSGSVRNLPQYNNHVGKHSLYDILSLVRHGLMKYCLQNKRYRSRNSASVG